MEQNHMQVDLNILKASGRLDVFESGIRAAFEDVVGKIKKHLPLSDVDIVVVDNPEAAIPETGVGGFAPTAHLLYININPSFPDLAEKIGEEIKSTLAHELHHCARWEAVGYGKTLLGSLVSEGLADHFDIEINGGKPKPWSTALQGELLEKITERARVDFENEKYNHPAWFFGSEKEGIPRWAGYSIGFDLVKNYMQKSGKTAAELVSVQAELFLQ